MNAKSAEENSVLSVVFKFIFMLFKPKIILLLLVSCQVFADLDINDIYIQGDSTLMGMKTESSYFSDRAFLIETTGARFEYVKGQLKIYQGLDKTNRRLLSTITFDNEPNFVKVKATNDHILLWSKDLNLGIYGDSTLIVSPKVKQQLKCRGNFKPDYEGRYKGELLLIDDLGGMEIYPQRYEAGYKVKKIELGKSDWIANYELNAGERVMIAAFPGMPFDWENSFKNRIIVTHGCDGKQNIGTYGQMAPESTIREWSRHFDIVVVFYEGLYKRNLNGSLGNYGPYIVENEIEFKRFVKDVHKNGMKIATYTSFGGHYSKFKTDQTYYKQIEMLRDKFQIDGIYIDGLTADGLVSKNSNKIMNWEMVRCLRKLFGAEGVIILHGTHIKHGLFPGTYKPNPVTTVPNIDSYCTATLNGELVPFGSFEEPHLFYCVKKYGISNTIGIWRASGKRPSSITDEDIIDAALKMNCRWESHSWVMNKDGMCKWSDGMSKKHHYYLKKLDHLYKSFPSFSNKSVLSIE